MKKISSFLKRKNGKLIFGGVIVLILALIMGGTYLIWDNNHATVYFDTDGGKAIKKVYVKKGNTLDKEYVAEKLGYTFFGWEYKDKKSVYSEKDKITKDIILKAQYSEEAFVTTGESYIEDASPDIKIIVYSDDALTNDNINKYFSLTDTIGSSVEMNVKKEKENYVITPVNSFIEGYTYEISSLDLKKAIFIKVGSINASKHTKAFSFTIKKENKYEYKIKDNIKTIPAALNLNERTDKMEYNETTFNTYSAKVTDAALKNYKVNDVVLINDNPDDKESLNYYVITDVNISDK